MSARTRFTIYRTQCCAVIKEKTAGHSDLSKLADLGWTVASDRGRHSEAVAERRGAEMSGATLYALPTSLTAPAQQARRCGHFPRDVLNLQRIRRERDDKRSLEQAHQTKANETLREQVRTALRHALYLDVDVDGRNMVGVAICAVDADGDYMDGQQAFSCGSRCVQRDSEKMLL